MYYEGMLGLKGKINIKHFDFEKRLLSEENIDNVIVNVGKAQVAGLILHDAGVSSKYEYIAVGADNTAANATDTVLGDEITTGGGERAAATGTRVLVTVASDTAQLVNTFSFTNSFSVVESGLFNDPSSGEMLARQTFSAKNVDNGDSLQVTWKVTVS
jgi:hypothetical protein